MMKKTIIKDGIQLFIWGCLIVNIPWLHKEIDIKNFGNCFKNRVGNQKYINGG